MTDREHSPGGRPDSKRPDGSGGMSSSSERGERVSASDGAAPDAAGGVDPERVYDALANDSRRQLVGLLSQSATEALTIAELVTHLVDGRVSRAGTGDEQPIAYEDARIELRHVHLPKLAATGLIEVVDSPTDTWDDGRARITPRGQSTLREVGLFGD